MENEIIVVTEETAIVKFKENTLEAYLKTVEENALNYVGSVETKKGRDGIISKAASVTKIKTTIEKAKKRLTESQRAFITNVNAEGKKSFEFLADLSSKVRQPVTDYEKEQEEIEQARRDQAEFDIAFDEAVAMNDLFDREREVKRKEDEQKAKEDARIAREKVEGEEKTQREYEDRIQREAQEKVDLEAEEEIEQAKRDKIAAEEKVKADAIRVEKEKKEALELAERQKKEAIEQAKIDAENKIAEKARLKRIADEDAKFAADKKASHHAHQKKFNREALECFKKNGFEEETAIRIITLIAKKEISHITMNY